MKVPTRRIQSIGRVASPGLRQWGPVSVDLFADVRVETSNGILEWAFDPAGLEWRDSLPWMRAVDWVQLYKLFNRPARVKALTDYLAGSGSVSTDREE